MRGAIDHTNLHRTAKYFMDNGRAETPEDAVELLRRFGLTVLVGSEILHSAGHQTALLSLVNAARRTFLGGVEVVGLQDAPSISLLMSGCQLAEAVRALGGTTASAVRSEWPCAVIGDARLPESVGIAWRLTWEGWRGGVVPLGRVAPLSERDSIAIAPILAAAVCAAEVFAYHAGDHPMAGRRSAGMSLWNPGADWLGADPSEPALAFLPARLWLIGLGNLGQAFAWVLACLPFSDRKQIQLMLQDFDDIAPSNDSTSLLSFLRDIDRRKARVVADWLEARGFVAFLNERRFGDWTRRGPEEPAVALCGVDNALARAALEKPGFDLVVEAGLGGGPQAFRNFSIHTFPASRTAERLWLPQVAEADESFEAMPAYQALRREGMDDCGLAQLASRTVGVPFVGLIAACVAISELLRRLHGGAALELASGSALALENVESVSMTAQPYAGGHVAVA
ncbi:hypothetical protein [Reyranella sp.]|uniref:hypothetical protein n=1 Tax=Reyranella sp. TaxID=1929291 RepID=UPI00122BDD86|nr:hypothetical protein [Reyranella sp.]TAJ81853.1 MAG: thiamine biosynthesis protein ThiF [Reyranella sp.]